MGHKTKVLVAVWDNMSANGPQSINSVVVGAMPTSVIQSGTTAIGHSVGWFLFAPRNSFMVINSVYGFNQPQQTNPHSPPVEWCCGSAADTEAVTGPVPLSVSVFAWCHSFTTIPLDIRSLIVAQCKWRQLVYDPVPHEHPVGHCWWNTGEGGGGGITRATRNVTYCPRRDSLCAHPPPVQEEDRYKSQFAPHWLQSETGGSVIYGAACAELLNSGKICCPQEGRAEHAATLPLPQPVQGNAVVVSGGGGS